MSLLSQTGIDAGIGVERQDATAAEGKERRIPDACFGWTVLWCDYNHQLLKWPSPVLSFFGQCSEAEAAQISLRSGLISSPKANA